MCILFFKVDSSKLLDKLLLPCYNREGGKVGLPSTLFTC